MSEGVDVNLDEFGRAASGLRRLLELVGLKCIARELKNNPLIDYFNRPPPKRQYVHDAHDEDDMDGDDTGEAEIAASEAEMAASEAPLPSTPGYSSQ